MGTVTVERLREVLDYNPDTGILRWKTRRGRIPAGAIAGAKREDGYVEVRVDKKKLYAHRIAWAIVHGEFPITVDHRNQDPSDNRLHNLRAATASQNQHNRGPNKNSTTGIKGVHAHVSGRFVAEIWVGGTKHYLGIYDTPLEAQAAYKIGADTYHGAFANYGDDFGK